MRTVLFHYHLFKNAGTSLDASLQDFFSPKEALWVTREFSLNHSVNGTGGIKDWIVEESAAVVFSSHTAKLEPPVVDGVNVLSLMFIRHPIDRIASAYAFERKQLTSNPGAVIARNTNLAGYIEIRLSLPHDRQCNNFQSSRLCTMFSDGSVPEKERALSAIKKLSFVGLVEEYNTSLTRLEEQIKACGIDVNLVPKQQNISRSISKSLEERLIDIRMEIGEDLYERLLEENSSDIKVWEEVRNIYK